MYEYQLKKHYFAQISDDIKDLGAKELSELGASKIRLSYRGIYFYADQKSLYRINYSSRLVSRIIAPLISFHCSTHDQLYERAKMINWTELIPGKNTFAVFSSVSDSSITNSHYASLRLKDSIVDSIREIKGKRPDIDSRNPDIWLNLHIRNNKAVISLDTSGGSLHRRGYRKHSVTAPMQEIVAAAIIRYSEWNGTVPLYDPMCGSGTILSEALMHYCRIPAGIFRDHFGFEFMPDYNKSLWSKVKKAVDTRIRELPEKCISGSDASSRAAETAEGNIQKLPYGKKVNINVLDFRKFKGLNNGIIITNPPYGIRTGNRKTLGLLYKSLGDLLKQKCKGSTAYIYFGEREFIKKIGLKPAWKKPLKTGRLDGRLVKYEMY